ncbi:unnamed protein product [Prorocentrum cordatum]|uniref:Uncharacterized protein n=1 Tax=Prorocentrum cordatum TaxID=2364126 RepID=A0ABN9W5X1_9DINO|nr:unnamed protein product [Polarella glacialis]
MLCASSTGNFQPASLRLLSCTRCSPAAPKHVLLASTILSSTLFSFPPPLVKGSPGGHPRHPPRHLGPGPLLAAPGYSFARLRVACRVVIAELPVLGSVVPRSLMTRRDVD